MKPWQRIEPTTITKVGWRTVTSKTFVMPDGTKTVWDLLHPDGQQFATVLALTPDNKIIIARQFRTGAEKSFDELPGGFVDKDESPEVAMHRELLEETGYSAGQVSYLGTYHKDVFLNATWHAFLARGCTKVAEPISEEGEHIEVALMSIDELMHSAMHDGTQDHAVILMAYDQLQKLKQGDKG